MKKAKTISLNVGIALALFAVFLVPAASATTVSIGSTIVGEGETGVVSLMVNDVTDLGGVHVNLTYDASVVNVTALTNSDFDSKPNLYKRGHGWVLLEGGQYESGLSGSVKLCDVTLEAVGKAGESSYLNLTDIDIETFTYPPTDIPIDEVINGTFTIKPVTPSAKVVINEFEQNPPGDDSGNEWIELYNNDSTSVNIGGWKLINSGGKVVTIPDDTVIAVHGYWVANWTNGSLEDSNEYITLYNATGTEIDNTLTAADGNNDERCWARYPNGIDTDSDNDWKYQTSTMGETNGVPVAPVDTTPPTTNVTAPPTLWPGKPDETTIPSGTPLPWTSEPVQLWFFRTDNSDSGTGVATGVAYTNLSLASESVADLVNVTISNNTWTWETNLSKGKNTTVPGTVGEYFNVTISEECNATIEYYSVDKNETANVESMKSLTVRIKTPVTYTLTITSTAGGNVTEPSEGTHTYDANTVVALKAVADTGYVFVNWTGDVDTIEDVNASETSITMNDNYTITANFKPIVRFEIPFSVIPYGTTYIANVTNDSMSTNVGKDATIVFFAETATIDSKPYYVLNISKPVGGTEMYVGINGTAENFTMKRLVMKDETGITNLTFNPEYTMLNYPLWVGKTWASTINVSGTVTVAGATTQVDDITAEIEGKVTGEEYLTTPYGELRCLVVENNASISVSGLNLTITAKYWISDNETAKIPKYQSYTNGNLTEELVLKSAVVEDTTPPASVSNLNKTTGVTWINWTWTNPLDSDFGYVMVYLNGTWKTNTSVPYYNATELLPNTSYTISTRTADTHGNINQTWVNDTAKTLTTPYYVYMTAEPAEKTVKPNEDATYTLTVKNLGTNTDNYTLTVDNVSNADIAILNTSTIQNLSAGAKRVVLLTVRDEAAGTYIVNVTATSEADKNVTDTVSTITKVKIPPTPTPRPRVAGGGGGGGAPRDSDGDGITDIEEMLQGTDPKDPCDPNPECAACKALMPATPAPTTAPVVSPTPKPTVKPTPVPTPAPATPTPTPKPTPGYEAVFMIAGLLAVAYLVQRKRRK